MKTASTPVAFNVLRRSRTARRWGATLALAGLFSTAPGHAQEPVQAPPPPSDTAAACPPTAIVPTTAQMQTLMQAARDRGFLWRLSKDGHDSWLYGTIHVARLEWDFFGPAVMEAVRASDTLALELDPGDPEVQTRIREALFAVRPTPLPTPLSERLIQVSRAECLPTAPFDTLAPDVRVMLLGTLLGRRDGLDPAYGIDQMLSGLGHARKMEVVSLETPELQLQALAMPTEAARLAFIEQSVNEMASGAGRAQLARLAQAWADGDLDALVGNVASAEAADPQLERALMKRTLDDRNPGLADGIDALHLGGKRVFAAVGSAHMAGPLGLPALLALRGFTVERIAYPQ